MQNEPRDPSPVPNIPGAPPNIPPAATGEPNPSPPPLTPEEQMALFEQELKEQDWGHQPC